MTLQADKTDEKTVVFGYVPKKDGAVRDQLKSESAKDFAGIEKAVMQFTKVNEYTTFAAEYALKDDENIHMHFFLPKEMLDAASSEKHSPAIKEYWTNIFPGILSASAEEYFGATKPRLQAKYTEELRSWWFLAQGYGDRIDFDKFVKLFLKKLDAALERKRS